jgi:arsenate reductase
MEKVLFLCTGNSARSQMAEAILRRYGGDRFEVFSAGLEPKGINPLTIQAMKAKGYDLSGQRSKYLDEYAGKVQFDYLITVCGNAEEKCPYFPGMGTRLHWPFDDPAAVQGSEEEKLSAFSKTRDALEAKIQSWLDEEGG